MRKGKHYKVKTFKSREGRTILAGQTDESNDYLTFKRAGQNDLWFHVANFPGSHVILLAPDDAPSPACIKDAAGIAAYYSKMKNASRVPVSYCLAKFVKKPKGAKAGTVTIKNEKTVTVAPALLDEVRDDTG